MEWKLYTVSFCLTSVWLIVQHNPLSDEYTATDLEKRAFAFVLFHQQQQLAIFTLTHQWNDFSFGVGVAVQTVADYTVGVAFRSNTQ